MHLHATPLYHDTLKSFNIIYSHLITNQSRNSQHRLFIRSYLFVYGPNGGVLFFHLRPSLPSPTP